MAQQATVHYVDDLEYAAGRRVPADHKGVKIGIDGKHYEIDLSDENYRKLAEILSPLVAAGRRSHGRAGRGNVGPYARQRAERDENQAVREWAREQGMKVSERGRIPADILEKYERRNIVTTTNGNGRAAAAHHAIGANPIWMPPTPAAPEPAPEPPAPTPAARTPKASTEPPKEGQVFRNKAEMNRAIRAWCREKGHPINERGAVPKDVAQVYAHHNGEPRLAE